MKYILFFIFLISFQLVYCQNDKTIPVELIKNGEKVVSIVQVYLHNSDTTFLLTDQTLNQDMINKYSIGICYKNHRILIPQREDTIEYIHVFLDKKSYMKKFYGDNPIKGHLLNKSYYVDFGLDIIMRIGRSKKEYCTQLNFK